MKIVIVKKNLNILLDKHKYKEKLKNNTQREKFLSIRLSSK
jgi:hypothetical protein